MDERLIEAWVIVVFVGSAGWLIAMIVHAALTSRRLERGYHASRDKQRKSMERQEPDLSQSSNLPPGSDKSRER